MPVNRNPKEVWRECDSLHLDYINVVDVISHLQSLVDKYGNSLRIERVQYPYDDASYYVVKRKDVENEQELFARIAVEEKWEAEYIEREKKEFKRLKAKFSDE